MKRLSILLLALSTLLLLGGCAIEPAYQYTRTTDGGGYYSGQSAYGNADTVVYGSAYANPWTRGGYYGPGWGWSGVGFGATYTYRGHRDYRHRHHRRAAHHQRERHSQHPSSSAHQRPAARPTHRPPPARVMRIEPRHKRDQHPAH